MSKNSIKWKDIKQRFHQYSGIKASADWDTYCQLMLSYDMREVEILGEQPFIPQLLARSLDDCTMLAPAVAIFSMRRPGEQDEAVTGRLWLHKNMTFRCTGASLAKDDGRERTVYHWELLGMPVDAGRTLIKKEEAELMWLQEYLSTLRKWINGKIVD